MHRVEGGEGSLPCSRRPGTLGLVTLTIGNQDVGSASGEASQKNKAYRPTAEACSEKRTVTQRGRLLSIPQVLNSSAELPPRGRGRERQAVATAVGMLAFPEKTVLIWGKSLGKLKPKAAINQESYKQQNFLSKIKAHTLFVCCKQCNVQLMYYRSYT